MNFFEMSDPCRNRHFFQRGMPRAAFFREPPLELPPLLPRRPRPEQRALAALLRMAPCDRQQARVPRESDQPNERAAAGLAAHRFITSRGVSWAELLDRPALTPPPVTEYQVAPNEVWEAYFRFCAEHAAALTPWQRDFLAGVASRNRLTPAEATTIAGIAADLRAGGKE